MTTERELMSEQDVSEEASGLAARVFARFDQEGIAYCHWKSNEHLGAAMAGDTDLDVLIDAERMDHAYAILGELGCRRARVAAARNEPGLEDFFGVDPREGKLVHFHTHWRLATGERHLKRFRLPWERLVLDTRVRDEDTGTYVTAPAAEVVLCALRAALKLRWRDRLRLTVTRRPPPSLRDELAWLMKGTDENQVLDVASRWLGEDGAQAVQRCVVEGASVSSLEHLHRVARRQLRTQASHANAPAAIVRWRREVAWFQRGVARHYAPRPRLYGRGGGAGGLIVAVLGADGSGKSTLVGDLRRWFAPKFDTYPVYFGSGDGQASLLRLPLNLARRRLLGSKDVVARRNAERDADSSRPTGGITTAKAVWALTLAHEKHRKLGRAMRARTRGLLVITDRWPQNQVLGSTDGPLLGTWRTSHSPLRRWLAAVEARPYEAAEQFPPDLVLRLRVDPTTAARRRPEHGEHYLAGRIDIVNSLAFPEARFGVVELDATAPYPTVLDQAVQAAFSRI